MTRALYRRLVGVVVVAVLGALPLTTVSGAATDDVLAYSSLTLPNITTGKSDDGGNSFGPPNVFSQQVAGDDRMWMAADPTLNSLGLADIFMTYHDVAGPQDIQLGVSIDGG